MRGKSGGYEAKYRTDYLFTPPEIFRLDHLPDDPGWQLSTPAIDRGDFVRQQLLTPAFFAAGLEMVSPDRSQITVHDSLLMRLLNAQGWFLLGVWQDKASHAEGNCQTLEQNQRIDCALPSPGTYRVRVCVNREQYGNFRCVGQVEVNREK